MRCNVCGAQLDEGTKTCPYCGCATEGDGKEITVYTASDASVVENTGINADAAISTAFMTDSSVGREEGPSVGLKWAHFLGYFALWIGALVDLSSAVQMLTGSLYDVGGANAEMVYRVYGSLRYVDKFYGIGLLVLAGLAVLAAISILRYKAMAGTLVCALNGLSFLVGIAYIVMLSHIIGHNQMNASNAVGTLISIAFFCVNIVYFKKRKHIFVN